MVNCKKGFSTVLWRDSCWNIVQSNNYDGSNSHTPLLLFGCFAFRNCANKH